MEVLGRDWWVLFIVFSYAVIFAAFIYTSYTTCVLVKQQRIAENERLNPLRRQVHFEDRRMILE